MMANPETGPLNSLMMEEDKDPGPFPNPFFSPGTISISCLLCLSPDLHCRHPAFLSGSEVKHVLEPAFESVCHNVCVLVCVSGCFLFQKTSLSLSQSKSVSLRLHFFFHSVVSSVRPGFGSHHAQTVPLLCAGITDSFCTLSGGAAGLAPPPHVSPPTPLCTVNNRRH